MAAPAETLLFNPVETHAYEAERDRFVSADAIPELQFIRRRARQEAEEILEQNRQHLRDAQFEEVALPVDALGTARKVVNLEVVYGTGSFEHTQAMAGLVLDCRRLFAEAARKNTFEYFPPVRQVFGTSTQEYYSHGQSILGMTRNGLTPVSETEEQDRRMNEHVEEETYRAVRSVGRLCLSGTMSIATISECTDWALAAYDRRSRGGYGGYVPEINKLMVRNVMFDAWSDDRYEEQVGLPGTYITHEVVVETLRRRGIDASGDKTAVHGTQILHNDDVFDFVALLDTVASERWGLPIFMGEPLSPGHERHYETIRIEAAERQEKLEAAADELAAYIVDLERNETDRWLAVDTVEQQVKKQLLYIADTDNSCAADIFDEATAMRLREVAELRRSGKVDEALLLLQQTEALAPAPGYCGAGSCGLEGVDTTTAEGKKLSDFLKADAGDKIVSDKERACKNCGMKTLHYAYNRKKVNTGCTSCGALRQKSTS